MPLRADPSLWFNMPGVVAAYQPVRAPDSLLARYNMAHGGDNRYRMSPVNSPLWSGYGGLLFASASNQYMTTGVVGPQLTWSMLCTFNVTNPVADHALCGVIGNSPYPGFALKTRSGASRQYFCGSYISVSGAVTSGVMAVAGQTAYYNGVSDGAIATGTIPNLEIYAGCANIAGAASQYANGYIPAFAIYNRTLSLAEVWHVSRQMAYCDVNPDWSVWSPRRKWFPYVLAGGFQAAWAERANRLIGGG